LRTWWTRPALADLEGIGDFIARDNPNAADRIVMRIVKAVEMLRDHPHLGRAGRIAGTRELVIPETPYIVPIASSTTTSRFSRSFTARGAGRTNSARSSWPTFHRIVSGGERGSSSGMAGP